MKKNNYNKLYNRFLCNSAAASSNPSLITLIKETSIFQDCFVFIFSFVFIRRNFEIEFFLFNKLYYQFVE